MRDLLLAHGYFLHEDPKERAIMKPYAPLGILYLCSHLRANGFSVDIFDTTFASKSDFIKFLCTETPSVLGLYANLMTRSNVVEIVGIAHANGWTTIVGGPEPGAYSLEYLQAGAQFVVFGEGEKTLEELLSALRVDRANFDAIDGIAYLDADGNLHQNAPRVQIQDLDGQPWPAREAIDLHRYVRTWREHHGMGSINFITARGCPFRCNWCSHQVYGQSHRRRDPIKVVDEVEWLLETYTPDMVWISDDVFTINHAWIRTYHQEMARRAIHIPFECISRADRLTPEMMDLLAELGCFRMWIGSESGSQRILDAMDRGVKIEQVHRAVEMCRERNIQSGMFLMWGYEGEELEDIEATIRHVSTSQPDIFFTTVSYPIKGTPYYSRVSDKLIQIGSWGKTSDRELRVRGRHSRNFYSHADRLLREEVALARAKSGTLETNIASMQQNIIDARTAMMSVYHEVEQ
jgi:anaerobic magnesium-protoporphyrin IX monomethyl ester cyclase